MGLTRVPYVERNLSHISFRVSFDSNTAKMYRCLKNLNRPDKFQEGRITIIRTAEMNRLSFPSANVNNLYTSHTNIFINLEPITYRKHRKDQMTALGSHQPYLGSSVPYFRVSYVVGSGFMYRNKGLSWAQRSDALPYWIRNCKQYDAEERLELLSKISQVLQTQAQSKCVAAHSQDLRGSQFLSCQSSTNLHLNPEKMCAYSKVKIALAFENTCEEGYMTEKLWQPLMAGAVPFYYGAPDVKQWLPHPDAAILVSDFDSVLDAARYAKEVMLNESLWRKHTDWKDQPFSLKFQHLVRTGNKNILCCGDLFV